MNCIWFIIGAYGSLYITNVTKWAWQEDTWYQIGIQPCLPVSWSWVSSGEKNGNSNPELSFTAKTITLKTRETWGLKFGPQVWDPSRYNWEIQWVLSIFSFPTKFVHIHNARPCIWEVCCVLCLMMWSDVEPSKAVIQSWEGGNTAREGRQSQLCNRDGIRNALGKNSGEMM